MIPRHFLDLKDIDAVALRAQIDMARQMKESAREKRHHPMLPGRKLAMIFEKPSTRTRVSFESAMLELGGHAIHLSAGEMQLGRGESVADTAKVLSRYVDAIMMRCNGHGTLLELATYATIPVINGLSDRSHPCQLMADILTFEEHKGGIRGSKIVWVGDGNNMAHSWITAAEKFDFSLVLSCPDEFAPDAEYVEWAKERGADVTLIKNPAEAVKNADAVVADTWVSMGDKDADRKMKILAPYQVNQELMSQAEKSAIFLHCLPAHRGEEVTEEVIDGMQSVVFDEAENRLHAQKAILHWCMG